MQGFNAPKNKYKIPIPLCGINFSPKGVNLRKKNLLHYSVGNRSYRSLFKSTFFSILKAVQINIFIKFVKKSTMFYFFCILILGALGLIINTWFPRHLVLLEMLMLTIFSCVISSWLVTLFNLYSMHFYNLQIQNALI